MTRQWTESEAWQWYNKLPWLRGCNFIGSDCCSRIDMWQSFHSEEHLKTAEREIALAETIGFNTIRLLVEFDVWYQERDSFMSILESYIDIAARHHQSVMITLANEAVLCRGEDFVPKPLGEQFYALGYHQGRLPETPEQKATPCFHPMEKDYWRGEYLRMVREIVRRYAGDPRILCWNVYNEPGIRIGSRSVPLLEALFDAVRSENPIQPLCADLWRGLKDGKLKSEEERFGVEHSDVISYHSYTPYRYMVPELEAVRKFGRPILITEWLNRINHSTIAELYPLFYLENIACWCWGFVVGKTQTHEPWDTLWDQYDLGLRPDLDFTVWQHDLFRPNLRPYDPHEIELLREYNALADKRFSNNTKK